MPVGVYKHNKLTEEHKRKIGLSHKGKITSELAKQKISKANKGHKVPESAIAKMRLSMLGKKHTEEWKRKKSESMIGKNHPNWKGGKTESSKLVRNSAKYEEWRKQVFIRDEFTCCECGVQGGDLEVHHIKKFSTLVQEAMHYFPLLNIYDACMLYTPLWSIFNGKVYCKKCHRETDSFGVKRR